MRLAGFTLHADSDRRANEGDSAGCWRGGMVSGLLKPLGVREMGLIATNAVVVVVVVNVSMPWNI